MIQDGILEVSSSPILNPLTVVHREGKKVPICVDARKVHQFTIPDCERTAPLQELLQQFDGAQYMTSLRLSYSFLQVDLHEDSQKYTVLFDSTVYQYKRVPYENSLSAFIRALNLALGGGTERFVCFTVMIYSSTLSHSKNISGI
jgi:hypothetical protein